MKKALIISDGKPGHFNQSIALCSHLQMNYEIFPVKYKNKQNKGLSYLLDHIGLYPHALLSDFKLPTSDFDLIISTGSTTYYANKLLSRHLKCPNIAILKPNGYRLNFSHIFCPTYDHPPKRPNITELPLNLCAADQNFFAEKADEFLIRHKKEKTAIGVIIGGANAVSELAPDQLKKRLDHIFDLSEGMERWVTTSRRTPPEVETLVESYPFDFKLINSKEDYNPIPAFIQLCDRLFVTSDSASMISECASFGKAKVEILMNRQLKTPNKFEELIDGLEQKNAVHRFSDSFGNADTKISLKPLLQQAISSSGLQ